MLATMCCALRGVAGMSIALRRLPAPGRSVWWLSGAILSGFALPAVLCALLSVASFYPIGSALPDSWGWAVLGNSIGAILAVYSVAAVVAIAGMGYALLAWDWRPAVLALFFV